MSLDKIKRAAMALLILSVLFWALGQFGILYIPGLSFICLAGSMIFVALYMFRVKSDRKLWGILIMAFGLLCLVSAGIQIYASVSGLAGIEGFVQQG